MQQKERWFTALPDIIRDSRSGFVLVFCGLALAVFVMLVFRNAGLNPVVFADEWTYSSSARLIDIARSAIPSYLFLLLFESTSRCGAAFLECARLANVFFIIAAMPFIYLTARRYTSKGAALLVAMLAVLSPFNSYTAYFMPETLYFLAFWIFTWYALSPTALRTPWRYGAGGGLILGLMMAVKFHAIFLLAGFVGCITLCALARSCCLRWTPAIKVLVAAVVTAFISRLVVGYAVAGAAGLSLTGNFYGGYASSALNWTTLLNLIQPTLVSLGNHFLALCILFTVPLASLLAQPRLTATPSRNSFTRDQLPLLLFTPAMLLALLCATALYTALAAGSGPYETTTRLHMRYYDFAFPLFYILAAAQLNKASDTGYSRIRVVAAALLVAGLAAFSLGEAAQHFEPSIVDNPELRGLMANPQVFFWLGLLGIVAVLCWAFQRNWGAKIFLFLFLPLAVASSSFYVSKELRNRMIADEYDRAGQFAKLYLGQQTSGLLIAGSAPAANFRALFHIDNPQATLVHLAPEAPLTGELIPPAIKWVLLIGQHELDVPALFQIDLGDYRLAKISVDDEIDFRDTSWPGSLKQVHGLSSSESFGRWSNAAVVELHFLSELNGAVQLTLSATAFGPNVGQPFTLRVGDQEQTFVLQTAEQEVSLRFNLSKPARDISIVVPQPTSPKMLGMSTDERLLGIAMHKLQIKQVNEK